MRQIAQTGCRRLIIGIDGLTSKVQELMNKHTDLTHTERILSWCDKYNIAVQVNVIVGFPGQVLEDCMGSLKYLKENKIFFTTPGSSFAFTPFYLVKGAAWEEIPIVANVDNSYDLALCYEYEVKNGIGMKDTQQLTLELMQKADEILDASKRAPLIREFAFLYNDYYHGIKDPSF